MIEFAKRTKNERTLVHNWHPYYAGFSELFVQSVLDQHKDTLSKDSLVLDPWVGSGTTSLVCQKNGYRSIGIDINIAMATFSAAKSSEIIDELECSGKYYLEEIINLSKKMRKSIDVTDLSEFMHVNYAKRLKKIVAAIEIVSIRFNQYEKTGDRLCPVKSFFRALVLICNRELMGYVSGSNPTWFKSYSSSDISLNKIESTMYLNFERMLQDLKFSFSGSGASPSSVTNYIYVGSSESIRLENESIDLIITSPPYLTRIDYASSTKLEITILTTGDVYEETRRKTIGTTIIHSQDLSICNDWGPTCNQVLKRVFSHESYSSSVYYIKNKIQYFRAAYSSLNELFRVLKNGCYAYLVVQNSYYKDIEIDLAKIYCEMAVAVGFQCADIVRKDALKTTMASINTKSNKYVKDKRYYEYIIRICK